MRVLALNPGSTSLRFRLVSTDDAAGAPAARSAVASVGAQDPTRALDEVRERLAARTAEDAAGAIDAVGVRVVACDPRERAAALADDALLAELERACERAPLHGPVGLALLRAARAWGRALPVVAVFDSAFHADLPAAARSYALPDGWSERHGVRRFGYHGLAVASALEEHERRTPARGELRRVVLHLGGGASVSAVRGARCVDTSMGFSPLEGLVMSTRSGDVDPTLVAWLARAEGLDVDAVVRALHERAGLLGLSGTSGDMREIERLRAAGDARAGLAFDVFVHRARRWLGAMAAVLGGLDEALFSGGIGENSPAVRAAICADMTWCGLRLDPARNARPPQRDGRIAADGSAVGVFVVPVDEERGIARATAALLCG